MSTKYGGKSPQDIQAQDEFDRPASPVPPMCGNCTHFRRYGHTSSGTCTAGRFDHASSTQVHETYGQHCRWFMHKDKMMRGGVKK